MNMEKLKKLLTMSECDALIIASEQSCFYFTGYTNDFCYIVYSEKGAVYFTDKRYLEEAGKRVKAEIKEITAENAMERVAAEASNYKKIGIDETKVYYSDYIRLHSALKTDKIINIGGFIDELRAIKTPGEILKIKKAAEITDAAYSRILLNIREGMTEKELAAIIDSSMLLSGADDTAFDTIVGFSEGAACPHWHKSGRKLKRGDCILMDFGAKLDGYYSDMTRMVSFGKPTSEYLKVYKTVLDSNKLAIEQITANMGGAEADAIARNVISDAGYRDKFIHSLGHGVGIEIHEAPRLSMTSKHTLKDGMVFTVEPGIYLEGRFGVRIEDLVILNGRVEILSSSDKELMII